MNCTCDFSGDLGDWFGPESSPFITRTTHSLKAPNRFFVGWQLLWQWKLKLMLFKFGCTQICTQNWFTSH